MQDFQQRVVDEKAELDEKTSKLERLLKARRNLLLFLTKSRLV